MFGLSPTKILFTIAAIVVVWYGFKLVGRYQKLQQERSKEMSKSDKKSSAAKNNSKDADYEELVACSKCGDFVIADKKSGCGKKECPYDH